MPSMGFIARLAMPVLKFMDVMSRIAVPVVSEPVPAVVGTEQSICQMLSYAGSLDILAIKGLSF